MKSTYSFRSFLKLAIPTAIASIVIYTVVIMSGVYILLINQTKNDLAQLSKRIQEDISIKDGRWDISLYNADGTISDADPIYIITSEGYIIERSRPINGLLDLSQFNSIEQYKTPTTIEAVTGESWRVSTTPISAEGQQTGAIYVAYYLSKSDDLHQVDSQLQEISSKLLAAITLEGDRMDTSKIDTRSFPYDINFEIVNKFNRVIFKSGNINSITRIPDTIDRSYIDEQIKSTPFRGIIDQSTKKSYLTLTTPVLNDRSKFSGIIVTGKSTETIWQVLKVVALISLVTGFLGLFLVLPLVFWVFKKKNNVLKNTKKALPHTISFIKKDQKLVIDNQEIEIPYASYQYYFCQALFQKPQKKWEADELLELFGEEFNPNHWRKVYDTMIALNKKVGHLIDNLFIVNNKRYSINPALVSRVKSINS